MLNALVILLFKLVPFVMLIIAFTAIGMYIGADAMQDFVNAEYIVIPKP